MNKVRDSIIAVLGLAALILPATLAGATDGPRSDLDDYPGFGDSLLSDEARYENEDMARQEAIAACMGEQGLPYVVRPTSVAVDSGMSDSEIDQLNNEYSTDPNIEYAESLPKEERTVYYLALFGVPDGIAEGVPFGSAQPFETVPLEEREEAFMAAFGEGCEGDAYRALLGVFAARAILTPERHAMRLAIENDSEARAAREGWAQCMTVAPGTFASQDALESALSLGTLTEADLGTVLERDEECALQLSANLDPVRIRHENEFVDKYRDVLDKHS